MSFDTYEISQESGEPIELYEFVVGTETFRYTSYQTDVSVALGTFEAIPIRRGRILRATGDTSDDRLEVELPSSNVLVSKFISTVPGKKPQMTLYQKHVADAEVVTAFEGVIATVRFDKNGRIGILQVVPLTVARNRIIPRFTYQGLCNHMLYDSRCKISETSASWEKFLNVSAVSTSGVVLTVDTAGSFGADFFENGLIEFENDFRWVVAQGGTGDHDLTIDLPFVDSPLGKTVRCLAGCKKRLSEDCNTKFSNVLNYGGWPYVPKKNPFETGLD